MADKAELLEQVEERELKIGQLSGETETIGMTHSPPPLNINPSITVQGSILCYTRIRGKL